MAFKDYNNYYCNIVQHYEANLFCDAIALLFLIEKDNLNAIFDLKYSQQVQSFIFPMNLINLDSSESAHMQPIHFPKNNKSPKSFKRKMPFFSTSK